MIKYIIGLILIILCFSCTALKKKAELNEEVVEEIVEEVQETTIPDFLPEDISPQGNCKEDWRTKDRKVIYRNDARIKRMDDATDGQIYVTARVGKDGYVNLATIDKLNTTVSNQKILNMALEIVQEYQFEPSETAPTNDCGVVKFNLTSM